MRARDSSYDVVVVKRVTRQLVVWLSTNGRIHFPTFSLRVYTTAALSIYSVYILLLLRRYVSLTTRKLLLR